MAQYFHLGGGGGGGGGRGGMAQNHFSDRTLFFDLQFKNTSNLILLGFKMSSERFFIQEFQNRVYFLPYVIFQFSKFGPKLSTFGWDTL